MSRWVNNLHFSLFLTQGYVFRSAKKCMDYLCPFLAVLKCNCAEKNNKLHSSKFLLLLSLEEKKLWGWVNDERIIFEWAVNWQNKKQINSASFVLKCKVFIFFNMIQWHSFILSVAYCICLFRTTFYKSNHKMLFTSPQQLANH